MENLCFLSGRFGEQKSVQIYVDCVPYLALHHELRHGKILDKFLEEFGICFEREINFNGNFHAKLCGDNYSVVGMSKADSSSSGLYFFGRSLGFNMGFSINHLEKIKNYTNLDIEY